MFQDYDSVEKWARGHIAKAEIGISGKMSSPVVLGRWELARVSLGPEPNGEIRASLEALVVSGRVLTSVSATSRTRPGTPSEDVELLFKLLRKCRDELPGLLSCLLEEACRDALEGGMPTEEVLETARRSVVADVMSS